MYEEEAVLHKRQEGIVGSQQRYDAQIYQNIGGLDRSDIAGAQVMLHGDEQGATGESYLASQHAWRNKVDEVHTERKDHGHVTGHAGAILPAAQPNVLRVKGDGCVEDEYSYPDSLVGFHGVTLLG